MTDKELRRLSRMELIQLLLEQTRETERLQKELDETKKELEDRRILISNAGSIVEASVQINQLMETAQKTVDQYVENAEREYLDGLHKKYADLHLKIEQLEKTIEKRSAQMLQETQRKADGDE